MKRVRRTELQRLLRTHVCDIFFLKRHPERSLGSSASRQMLCTNSPEILKSENGYRVLNYRDPRGMKKVNTAKHNLVVTWDIMMQDWRNVSLDFCFIVNKYPANDEFWKYFNKNLFPMSRNEKIRYMDTQLNLPK